MFRLVNLFFYSSFFIALCAAALSVATYILLELDINRQLAGFIFFGTLFIYNSHGLISYKIQDKFASTERHTWIRKHSGWLLGLSFLALAAGLLLFQNRGGFYIGWLAHLVVLSVGYTVPFIPYKRKWYSLRQAPLLKVLLIAYVWAAVTVQLPLLNQQITLTDSYGYFVFYGRFLFIFALALLFDIRDAEQDKSNNIITLPNLIGISATKITSVVLLLIFAVLVFVFYPVHFSLALSASAVAAVFVVLRAQQFYSEKFYSGWADGMMLLQAVLVIIAGYLC